MAGSGHGGDQFDVPSSLVQPTDSHNQTHGVPWQTEGISTPAVGELKRWKLCLKEGLTCGILLGQWWCAGGDSGPISCTQPLHPSLAGATRRTSSGPSRWNTSPTPTASSSWTAPRPSATPWRAWGMSCTRWLTRSMLSVSTRTELLRPLRVPTLPSPGSQLVISSPPVFSKHWHCCLAPRDPNSFPLLYVGPALQEEGTQGLLAFWVASLLTAGRGLAETKR